ncbi:MAG TPA: flagellar biosynthesis anti-sigma factor FlgM [Casimicrobiaceae bacterium]|nr:flagellar biosynthesis anti-sigma factor FlgM [Casimicrobiaceae bacterium]
MKINPSVAGLDQGKNTASANGERNATGAASPSASPSQGDTIHLSALSSQLQALEASLATGGEFDRTKVEAIKDAIREGRLTVNPEVVADKMLASAMAMLGKDS